MTEPRPSLVVVCGQPASGKTTLARALGVELHLPVLVRDELKAAMASQRGEVSWVDPAEHRRLADDSFALFFRVGLEMLTAGCGVVMEAACVWALSRHELTPHRELADMVVVECRAPATVLRDRYAGRHERGERHPCHRDGAYVDRMDAGAFDWHAYDVPDDLDAPVHTVDSSDGLVPSLPELVEQIARTAHRH